MRKTAFLLLLVLSLVGAACGGSASATDGVRLVDAGTASSVVDDAGTVVLDIRTPQEFAEARLDGAVNIDFYSPEFADEIAGLPRDASYVMYCRSGNRSAEAATLMKELGFEDVAEIQGGILSWADAGLPLVSG